MDTRPNDWTVTVHNGFTKVGGLAKFKVVYGVSEDNDGLSCPASFSFQGSQYETKQGGRDKCVM
jgi:hypothetical protein